MLLHVVEHRPKPSFLYPHVAVEQEAEVAIYLLDGFVVAFGKAVVAVECDGADGRELLGEQKERVVGAAVVGNNDFGFGRVLDDGRQEATQHVGSVPVKYDNAQTHLLLMASPHPSPREREIGCRVSSFLIVILFSSSFLLSVGGVGGGCPF